MNEASPSYTQQELIQCLTIWMVNLYGLPKDLSSEQRDQWFRDNGLIAHFIRDHFQP